MRVSKEGTEINERFFQALQKLKEDKRISLLKFTKAHEINYWNITTVKNKPYNSTLKPEWIYYLVMDYGVSADWIITGRGDFYSDKEKPKEVITQYHQ